MELYLYLNLAQPELVTTVKLIIQYSGFDTDSPVPASPGCDCTLLHLVHNLLLNLPVLPLQQQGERLTQFC